MLTLGAVRLALSQFSKIEEFAHENGWKPMAGDA